MVRHSGGNNPHQQQEEGKGHYRTVARLQGTGLRYINGVASSYRGGGGVYPEAALAPRGVTPAAFEAAIDRVNNVLLMYWPCVPCFWGAYLCTPCTLGLSLGGPRVCVGAAEKYARFELECLNGSALFKGAGMRWELRKTCFRSWIEVQVLEMEATGDGGGGELEQQEQQEQQQL